jgi:pimeloyl-ACP methyl ester carboxylesterase
LEQQIKAMNEEQLNNLAVSTAAILTKNEEKRKLLIEWIKASDRNIYAQCTKEVVSYDARPKLKSISCPVVVLYAHDKAMPYPQERLQKLYESSYNGLKGVKLVLVPDSFHFIMWDNPTAFMKTLSESLPADNNPR